MGTSLIQEQDLDPNMGLAKEVTLESVVATLASLANELMEIKTAVNDAKTSADNASKYKMPYDMEKVYTYADIDANVSNMQHVSLSGKGVFDGMWKTTGSSYPTIIVDGTTILTSADTPSAISVGYYEGDTISYYRLPIIEFSKSLVIKATNTYNGKKKCGVSGLVKYYN